MDVFFVLLFRAIRQYRVDMYTVLYVAKIRRKLMGLLRDVDIVQHHIEIFVTKICVCGIILAFEVIVGPYGVVVTN